MMISNNSNSHYTNQHKNYLTGWGISLKTTNNARWTPISNFLVETGAGNNTENLVQLPLCYFAQNPVSLSHTVPETRKTALSGFGNWVTLFPRGSLPIQFLNLCTYVQTKKT